MSQIPTMRECNLKSNFSEQFVIATYLTIIWVQIQMSWWEAFGPVCKVNSWSICPEEPQFMIYII